MIKLLKPAVVLLLLIDLTGVALSQPVYKDNINLAGYDSIAIDPLKMAEAGIITTKQKILSVKAARKLLEAAEGKQSNEGTATALLSMGDAYIAHGSNRNAFIQLQRSLKMKDALPGKKSLAHLYYNLAIVFARQKNYPLAMKCFYKTGYVYQQTFFKRKRRHFITVDTITLAHSTSSDINNSLEAAEPSDLFDDAVIDADIFNTDTVSMTDNPFAAESPYIAPADVLNAFDDGREAMAYGIMVHVKQPVPGKKNIFVRLHKVGHTFITLVKFNTDKSSTAKTFGFYPEKNNYLAATPIIPATQSAFKNDVLHDWDEVIGKFIPQKQFERILGFIEQTSGKKYNLNSNNCTDMALQIANIANIEIEDTKGSWPLGRGNNPASAGQSILKGKFKNTDTNSQHGLFACSNNLFINRAVQ